MTDKILRHVVFFQFNDVATPEEIAQCGREFLAMPTTIPAIHHVEWGKNISDGQYDYCLHVIFLSEDGLKIYAEHPDHTSIGRKFSHTFANVTEINYWVDKPTY